MSAVFTIGIFLSLFLSVLLFAKKNNALSDKILAIWMITIAIYLSQYYLYYLGFWEKYPHLIGAFTPFPLLFGPLLYLYTTFTIRKEQRIRTKDWLHFLPFVLLYLLMSPFFFGYSAAEKIRVDELDTASEFRLLMMISLICFVLSGITYAVLSYKTVGDYQKMIGENFAYEDEISMRWLKFMIIGLAGIMSVAGVIFLMTEGLKIDFGFNTDLILFSLVVLFIFLIGYFGIRYQGIFTEKGKASEDIVEPQNNVEYKKTGLKSADIQMLHAKLLDLMTEKKPHLEPKLSLSQLAEKLDITANNLSQVINQQEGKNFYDFINQYRVTEFIERASSPENNNLNILGIAYDSGFNSKSSFNQVFKKITGKTPREYLTR